MNNDEKYIILILQKIIHINIYKKSSFDDFRDILKVCYENNIKLDIVFGPSHIRQWKLLTII